MDELTAFVIARLDEGKRGRQALAAMRKLLAAYPGYLETGNGGPSEQLRASRLAAVWSDHPDYRSEWKP